MATPFPFSAGAVLTAAQLNSISELVTNTQTDNYTLAATDAGDRVIANKATAITFTVPNSVFTAAQVVHIHNIGAGTLTIAAGAGATVNGANTLLVQQYQGGTLFFTSASSSIWFPTSYGVRSKVIASTRDLTAATGTVAYTGAGFKPRAVLAFGAVNFSIGSFGFGDSALANRAIHNTGGGTSFYGSSALILFETVSNNYQTGALASMDSDGFSITWTKVNTPTGTANLYFLCLG